MTEQDYDEIVAVFYRAAVGGTEWVTALNAVSVHFDAWAVPLMGLDKSNGALLFSHHGGPASPATSLDYIRRFHAIDPRTSPILAARDGEWVHCHEFFDDAYVAASPFYQEFLIPHGGRYSSGVKLVEDDRAITFFGVHRGQGRRPFDSEERLWLERIAAHAREAVLIYQRLRQTFEEAGAGRELLDKFAYPMLLVDELGSIRFRNTAAEAALADGDYAVDRSGVLACRDRQSHAELMAALQNLGLGIGTSVVGNKNSRRFLRIRRLSNGSPIITNLVAIQPHASMGAFGKSQVALVLFHDPTVRRELDPFLVAEMFDLTPAEARVAVQLRRGLSAQAIAEQSCVSLPTVRSQIQAIFAKTGVNRQPDLVRLLEGLAGFETLSG